MNGNTLRTILIIIAIFIGTRYLMNWTAGVRPEEISYSDLMGAVKQKKVDELVFETGGNQVKGRFEDGRAFYAFIPQTYNTSLLQALDVNEVETKSVPNRSNSIWLHAFISWMPMLLIIGICIYFMRQMQSGGGGGKGVFSFGKSRAKLYGDDKIKTTFKDVAGVDEAKEEVYELVEYLRNPDKFKQLGGRVPRGVLMVGPPGTGKTLLAKAIAGEAQVPFFAISGSDFVEMFVGVGASRVRDMFEQAKKQGRCIIFVDEVDAVGRHRGAGLGGGHDEREQTLNQLLVEMDGFEGSEGIIVLAATNRPDVLDPALLRPGRFDRQVMVPLPDIRGREQILKVHLGKVSAAENVDIALIARGTPGLSGADLANIINEAALFAARKNKERVELSDLEIAKDKIMMGAERRSMVISDSERRMTAYHESGHAIVGYLVGNHDPVYKVTIIPRGLALGLTMFLPERDRFSYSKEVLEGKIATLFGGRIVEELVFGANAVTTGASDDIRRATELAYSMVTKWGFSDKLGPLSYGEEQKEVFLGHSVSQHKTISDDTSREIDEEVRRIVDTHYAKAEKILQNNMDKLHVMAETLIQHETIDIKQIQAIMEGKRLDSSDGDSGSLRSSTSKKDNENENTNKKSSLRKSKTVTPVDPVTTTTGSS